MATLIKASGIHEKIEPKEGTAFTLEELQDAVHGYIGRVTIATGEIMVVNEDGHYERLPANPVASALGNDYIVGDVVVASAAEMRSIR